ncbi:MAG: hypothetical protein IJW20_07560 [Clostridia bacterium]|nr:hypothetical protein [Clostridia bacterium]
MNKKVSIKIFFVLLILLLINFNNVYAAWNMDERIERFYDEVEIDGEIYYVRKDLFDRGKIHTHIGYITSQNAQKEENKEAVKIVREKIEEYAKKLVSEDCPEEQRIQDDYYIYVEDLYSVDDENPYKVGDDIEALVQISATSINGTSNYWKENFSNNELYYDEYDEKYYVHMYYFVRLSVVPETNEYEIAYIDFKPENFDQKISELKDKGIDLESLDVKRILDTKYTDDIEVVPSSKTSVTSAEKTEYNDSQIEEISNMTNLIRITCIILLIIFVIVLIFRKKSKK